MFLGFLGSSDSKECNVGDLGLIPGLGRLPGGGHRNPLQYSCLENPCGQTSLDCSPWGHTESDMSEHLRIAQQRALWYDRVCDIKAVWHVGSLALTLTCSPVSVGGFNTHTSFGIMKEETSPCGWNYVNWQANDSICFVSVHNGEKLSLSLVLQGLESFDVAKINSVKDRATASFGQGFVKSQVLFLEGWAAEINPEQANTSHHSTYFSHSKDSLEPPVWATHSVWLVRAVRITFNATRILKACYK